jgi:hypothetical protein
MPGKAKIPAPIDRPLSRAYLRQFKGWSTAYPPGLSDPSTLRIMENVIVNRDGSVGIRPGLRYVAYSHDEDDASVFHPLQSEWTLVGTHEVFFLNDGTKAYLFAAHNEEYADGGSLGAGVDFFVATATDDPAHPFVVVPAETVFTMDVEEIRLPADVTYVKYLQIDNKVIVLNDQGEQLRIFYVDATKKAVRPKYVERPNWIPSNQLEIRHPDIAWIDGAQDTFGPAETPAAGTLISSTSGANIYNIGLFYTYYNELGESAPSQVKVVKVSRPWSGWKDDKTNGSPDEPKYYWDQLIARIQGTPGYFEFAETVHDEGALGAYLYMATWADGDPVPVEALLVDEIQFTDGSAYGTPPFDAFEAGAWWNHEGWFQLTATVGLAARTVPMPSLATRRNYTDPSRGGQGIVAADRLVVVNDPTQPAVIRWTSNQQGEYTNFSASRGGGLKTLTSGNLFIPACVKLWQNPQSVDTLTILCRGIDGMSTGYYMAPSEVTSQSESTSIMGFEETTASPGTTSPYGCEVFNNSLYHPVEDQLMKSTAANYAIRHKTLTELITRDWQSLVDKEWIISCEHDGFIYYIVHNPEGDDLEDNCKGNEVWVLDAAAETPTWSRWLVQGCALRKVELFGKVYMSLVRPEGIYVFDPLKFEDDVVIPSVTPGGLALSTAPIPWRIETNTQGANRAHDAWAHVQQVEINLGNFLGAMRWGIRGKDVNGLPVLLEKVTQDDESPTARTWDRADDLLVQRIMKEWYFFAGSVELEDELQPSQGQINLLQYRYAPSTVNTGYEFGSIETFEYGANVANGNVGPTVDGVPTPYADVERP